MNSTGGYVYFLYGANTFGRDEIVRTLKERMRALPAGEHNLTEIEGPQATVRALKESADVMPFLAERRMVIVYGLLDRLLGGQTAKKGRPRRAARADSGASPDAGATPAELDDLLAYLPTLPFTSTIAFVDGPKVKVDALVRAVPAGRALPRELPAVQDVSRWIRQQARTIGLEIDEPAVRELARLGGDDLRRLDAELRKLSAYVGQQIATRENVDAVVVGRDMTTWALLDGLAERRGDATIRALRLLIQQGESPEALIGRDVIPLYRRLVAAKELSLLDRAARVAVDVNALGLNPRTLPRLSEQVAHFDAAELHGALDLLLELDRSIKTGDAQPDTALELVVVQLCTRLSTTQAARAGRTSAGAP